MRVASMFRRLVAAGALAVLVSGCGAGDEQSAPPATTTIVSSATAADDRGGDADEVASDARLGRAGRAAESRLRDRSADDAWAVPDEVVRPLSHLWDDRVGAYVSPGGRVSTRLNSELLRIHAAAARAGYTGPARDDERARRIAAYLTGPAYVSTTDGERFGDSRHNAIHVPGWRESSAPVINQHPSVDAAVARGLRAVWLARGALRLPPATAAGIRTTVTAVAGSSAFRAPARLLNQINWNADLYAAAATVSGDDGPLRDDYREQLTWFAQHAHTPTVPGGVPNLSTGDGLHYQPQAAADATLNRSDTVEYASIVLGALRYYDAALQAGMEPLEPADAATLRAWATHTMAADWAPSGYLNWETGKGGSRLHLRQYWALALDGAVMATDGGGGLTGIPSAAGDRLLARASALFRRWTDDAGTVLLPATSFDFPSQFAGVRDNRTTASVRLAATLAEWTSECGCRGRLPDPSAADAPLEVELDRGFGRLAVNGPRYATAISPTAVPTGGGMEPAWLLDAQGRSLGALGGGGSGTLGLGLTRGGRAVLDTQPGPSRADALTLTPVPGEPRTLTGTIAGPGAAVRVTHRFEPDRIVTTYVVDPQRAVDVTLRVPSNGRDGTVRCAADSVVPAGSAGSAALPGCPAGRDYLVRSADGASMHVAFQGLLRRTRVTLSRPGARSTLPRPGHQATLRFRLSGRLVFTRTLRPDAG